MKTIARVLKSLMRTWRLGPAVSLRGSPTVSPTTAAECAALRLPPKCPASMNFFALSHAPPPVFIKSAKGTAVRVAPMTKAPTARGPSRTPTMSGTAITMTPGMTMPFRAALVLMSTARP